MKIVSVLRTGPEYDERHARFLHGQLDAMGLQSICMTNLPAIADVATVPLADPDLHGWWSKMELFNPDGPLGNDDLFYIDIDTLIIGDILPLIEAARSQPGITMLSDFFDPQCAASGLMFIPASEKRQVWRAWCRNPYWFMVRHRRGCRGGDQGFIAEHARRINRWDELCPGSVVSYKKHIAAPGDVGYRAGLSAGDGSVPADAAIVCFHGKPRPWELFESCKQSLLATMRERPGSPACSAPSPAHPPSSTARTKGRKRATARRSK